jgi:hypothetical protein
LAVFADARPPDIVSAKQTEAALKSIEIRILHLLHDPRVDAIGRTPATQRQLEFFLTDFFHKLVDAPNNTLNKCSIHCWTIGQVVPIGFSAFAEGAKKLAGRIVPRADRNHRHGNQAFAATRSLVGLRKATNSIEE